MLIGASIRFLLHLDSHGCSQISAQTVGKGLSFLISLTASAYLPAFTSEVYPGTSTPAGHIATHGTA